MEFCAALTKLEYEDDAVKLWGDLDEDKSNRVEFEEVDPTADIAMREFMALVEQKGGPLKFFTSIDSEQESDLKMSTEDFAAALVNLGFEPDAADLVIGGLDLDNTGEVSCACHLALLGIPVSPGPSKSVFLGINLVSSYVFS